MRLSADRRDREDAAILPTFHVDFARSAIRGMSRLATAAC
jgi:hypothetical protein